MTTAAEVRPPHLKFTFVLLPGTNPRFARICGGQGSSHHLGVGLMRNAPDLNSADNTAIPRGNRRTASGSALQRTAWAITARSTLDRLPERVGRSVRPPQLAASFISNQVCNVACPALTPFITLTRARARRWSARCYGVARQRDRSRQTAPGCPPRSIALAQT
jgi:hypothetical protein